MASSVKVTGQAQLAAKLAGLQRQYGARIGAALYRQGERLAADARDRYVPVDLGALKGGIRVYPPEWSARRVSVTVAAGTNNSRPYALAVHEHPSRHSPPSWRGGPVRFSPAGTGAKYLERPLMALSATLVADLAADLAVDRA